VTQRESLYPLFCSGFHSFFRFGVSNEKELKSLEVMVKKIDWKGLSEAEREKVRQQKKEEWNRVRREKKRMLNQKFDDLELSNVSPLPQAKPINLQGGLSNAAFGDIAMIVEFIYSYSKFLAPEETPTITAELLIKALAAGSQGANVVSKVVLVFLRTLIGEEEREINGLGIGLADMPLTTFTVSELLYHYLKLTCEMPVKEKDDGNDDDDDDDDASSVSSVASVMASHEEMPKKIIDKLEKNEIYTLPASDQLKVLIFLFYKIIDSEYFLDYLENLKMEAKELWREQDAFRKKAAKERKEEQSKNVESKTQSPSDVLKIDQFAKKLEPGAKTNEQKQDGDLKPTKEALVVSKGADDLEANKGLQNEEVKREKTSEDPKIVGSGQKEIMDLDSKVSESMMKDYPKEPVADLVHIVRQRRVMAAKQAALKDEEERKDKERRNELDELRQKTKKVQAWKDGLDRCKRSLRLEPIGVDRHFKLYWVFSQGMPGIYVEDGYMYYDARENRTIDSWECYDTVQDIDKLLKALAKQGVRESALKACISNQYKHITNIITKKNQEHFELQPYDVFEESIKVLKEDLLESGNKIVKGALGVILNHEGWEKKVEEAKTLDEMTPLLLDLQQSVMPKFLEGAMSQSKGEQVVQNWRDNVKQVKTMSALHTLLGILENSVKWDKSAENAKCKICRRKGGDDYLILCDECNRAYHPYCLRPALIDFPVSNWKCPACAPSLPLSRSRTRRKEEQIDYDETGRDDDSGEDEEKEEEKEQGDDEDDSDHEDQCHVCGEDGELICCDQCPKVYHLDCHEPPIRRLPRGIWICFVCRNPKMATRLRRAQESYEKSARHRNRISREKKQSRGTRGKLSSERRRRGYRDEEGDESESSGSGSGVENDTEEEVEEKHRRGSRRGRKSRRRGGSSVEESGGEEETSRKGKQKSRRKMPQKRRSSNTGDESSEPSPKSKKRGRKEPVVDEEPTTRQSRRRSRPLSENDEEDDADEPVSKRPTRRRKLRESEENSGETQREDRGNSSSKRRNSEELSFGRRSRNRNRGQNSEIVACENILKGMWKCKSAYHFRNPVDLKKVPDYSRFVINPMDLSRIRDKLEMLEYEDAFQFVDDVKLVFENSKRYNEDTSDVGQEAKDLEKEFYRLLRQNLPGLHSSLSDDN